MVTVKPLQGGLDSTAVTLREGGRVLFQYSDAVPPVLLVEMIPNPVLSIRGPQSAGKEEGALCLAFWEADVICLG